VLFDGQMGEKVFDFRDVHLLGVPLIVEEDVTPDPVYVSLLGANRIMLRKFQNLNHPKNHEYDGEIDESWDNYFSGTALSLIASRTVRLSAHDDTW